MKIKKIYKEKKIAGSQRKKCLVTHKVTDNKVTIHTINEPLLKGGSFIKMLVTENDDNLPGILTKHKAHIVCLLYNNKWYLGNYIRQQNLLKQNNTVLSLLYKLKVKVA